MPRRYEKFWQELLKAKRLGARLAPELHARMTKAVFNEKDRDKEARRIYMMKVRSDPNKEDPMLLVFTLSIKLHHKV